MPFFLDQDRACRLNHLLYHKVDYYWLFDPVYPNLFVLYLNIQKKKRYFQRILQFSSLPGCLVSSTTLGFCFLSLVFVLFKLLGLLGLGCFSSKKKLMQIRSYINPNNYPSFAYSMNGNHLPHNEHFVRTMKDVKMLDVVARMEVLR